MTTSTLRTVARHDTMDRTRADGGRCRIRRRAAVPALRRSSRTSRSVGCADVAVVAMPLPRILANITRAAMSGNLIVVNHPLVQHKLTLMRRTQTSTVNFRRLLREISVLLAYEATRDLPVEMVTIETPLATIQAPAIRGKKLCIVSILRAGNGILDGMLEIMPSARVGHIGLYRDPKTLAAIEYYFKVPLDIGERLAIVVDPMLATGHSAVAAVNRLKQHGAVHLKFACLLAAPEGVATFQAAHPDVPIYAAAVDERLNDHGYIVPGLGDAGDRLFGTK
jgi:uracil phosphoribosyltransferase